MDWLTFVAQLQSVEFSGRPFDSIPGFYVRNIRGLTAGASVARSEAARTRGPGSIYTSGRRADPRDIEISGFAFARSQSELLELNEQFASILVEESSFDVLAFQELGEWRWATVTRVGRWAFDRRKRTGFADYELSLRAPDQRVYGDDLRTSGWGQSVTVTNRGPYPSPVKVSVRGARSGYTINGPRGAQVSVSATLTSGSLHTYDGDTGVLRINDVPQVIGVTRSDRLEVPEGTHVLSVSAGAEILVSGSDTYVP